MGRGSSRTSRTRPSSSAPELCLRSQPGRPLRILCLGAHSDDIEIGCGGTILQLLARHRNAEVHWVVFSGEGDREREARRSARLFLKGAGQATVLVKGFRDGFFPYVGAEIKAFFEELKPDLEPDVVFTHYRADRHQDHRVISDLTWNTFRSHFVLEYEIPKYDGDLGSPNCFVALDESTCRQKIRHLLTAFPTQKDKRWFSNETFRGLLRLRGIEVGSLAAEAFYARKLLLGSIERPHGLRAAGALARTA